MYSVPRIMETSLVLPSPVVESLQTEQIEAFAEQGYLILPSFLSTDLVATLKREVDRWMDKGLRNRSIACCHSKTRQPPPLMELELGEHGWLISHPPLMVILMQLMGPVFAFHHLHSCRHNPGSVGKNWHHDYEQYPQTNRSHMMVHAFHYLDGLNGTIGDLVILPGSQGIIAERGAFKHLGVMPLPGEVVIDDLSPGSTVIIQSAVLHARRARSGGENQPRYFIDCSYCQGGIRWPADRVYWRHMLAQAHALGLDRGQWQDLFDEKHFYDPFDGMGAFKQINQGSLFERWISAQPDEVDYLKTTSYKSIRISR